MKAVAYGSRAQRALSEGQVAAVERVHRLLDEIAASLRPDVETQRWASMEGYTRHAQQSEVSASVESTRGGAWDASYNERTTTAPASIAAAFPAGSNNQRPPQATAKSPNVNQEVKARA